MFNPLTYKLRFIAAFIVLSITLIILGCNQENTRVDIGLNDKLKFDLTEYKNHLKAVITKSEFINNSDSSIAYADTLKSYYTNRDFQPNLIKSFEEQVLVDSLLEILNKADEHGLNAKYYHTEIILDEFQKAVNENTAAKERFVHLAKTDFLISDAVIKYSMHMRFGTLNPHKIFLDSYYLPIPDSTKRNIFEPLNQTNLVSYLHSIQPKSKKYKLLQSALNQFITYNSMEWKQIPVLDKKFKIGDTDSSLIRVAERLSILGFWKKGQTDVSTSSVYDSLFIVSIKAFQNANGLIEDGLINKATIEKLNTSPQKYVDKIKANLERIRWFDYSDSSRYILVNIPEFKLHVIENDEELFNITVCTGRKRYANFPAQYLTYKNSKNWRSKPEDWETPILYSQISHLILNPTWTVPSSIMREEIASKVRRDSAYLKKANFRVYKNGSLIDPAEVKVNELNSGSIPYTIIQNPGAGNALGKIKFMFDNPFGVYLHDTPTRAPFKYANRAVTHGCVRVEKPFQLAEYILADNSKWTIDYLKIEVGSKVENKSITEEFKQKRSELRKGSSFGQTTEVKLDRSIPLFIDYYTAWVDENGTVNFRDDVYRHDKTILENLAQIH